MRERCQSLGGRGVGVGKELLVLPKFLIPTFPLIGVLACVYVCVCLYVQALISAFCLVCIPTLHKTLPFHQADKNQGGEGVGMLLEEKKTDYLQVIQIHSFIESSTKTTLSDADAEMSCLPLGLLCNNTLVCCLGYPRNCQTRDEDFKRPPGEACPVLLLDMENVTRLRRAISFRPPKHTFGSSASTPAFLIDYYNSVCVGQP